ncbi:MAG: septal ring lytic transglycosylase RlpA family protein [Saprospiraceae bacterium]|jgi:rare lipoprotein A|nr:septal ring lytic transglycosylase RlpA family protein [Saprospiraceae bacterium]HRD83080.1 septal ring lytic transglycosylase RlpA family protein [Saprospiraceae bacterium]HRF38763.1 septal ring lytic transglycosylase RlpA family protein [Saprospiraceae bacterium]HRJ17245.1 septal ring lytic transglycosylase RlpA family protein [Saprospiraceae bacterium]HRK82899.1 septal ring lytic transglycosylase RlpA family protein [Saprospiraceae bacterium]
MWNKQKLFSAIIALFSLTAVHAQWSETGIAGYYADNLHGKKTVGGELYDKYALTAAHHNLPIGSRILITRLDNQQSVEVRVNDCCLAVKGRIVSLSRAAAEKIGLIQAGTAQVRIDLVSRGDGKTCAGDKPVAAYSKEAEKVTPKGGSAPAVEKGPVAPGTYRADALKPIQSGFGVQVGAYSDKANAEARVEEMRKKGFKDLLVTYKGADQKIPYKVIIGPFDTAASAAAYNKNLAAKHKVKGHVVSLKEG